MTELETAQQRITALEAVLAAMRAGGELVAYRHFWPANEKYGTKSAWEYFDAPTGEVCAECIPLYTHPQPAAQDAERYRWLRKNPAMLLHLSNKDFDAAIDAAIAAQQGDSHD